MDFNEWFNVNNKEHIEAFIYCRNHGHWPDGFIPENVELSSIWYIQVLEKIADKFLEG